MQKNFNTHAVPKLTSGGLVVLTHIAELKSKGLSDESTKCLTASNGSKILSPELCYSGSKARLEFNGSFLK